MKQNPLIRRLSQENEQEERRLKGQLTKLKKKQDTLERRYLRGDRQDYILQMHRGAEGIGAGGIDKLGDNRSAFIEPESDAGKRAENDAKPLILMVEGGRWQAEKAAGVGVSRRGGL